MNTRNYCFVAASLLFPVLGTGASIQGPELGLVFDSAKGELRQILGIPGAAVLGRPMALGVAVRKVAVSPLGDYVLAIGGEHNDAMVFAVGRNPLVVSGADRGAEQIALSVGGKSAALYYKQTNRIEVVAGFPGEPKVTAEYSLSSGQTLTAMAISDDGKMVLAAAGGRVFQVTTGGETPVAGDLGRVVSITIPTAGEAFIADNARNEILRVKGIGAGIETDVVAGSKNGINSPVAVAVARDGSRAFVANAKPGTVSIIDLRGEAAVKTVDCACKPTGLDRLAGNEVFRLTEFSKQPIWTVDAGGTEARVLFVPAEAAGSTEQ